VSVFIGHVNKELTYLLTYFSVIVENKLTIVICTGHNHDFPMSALQLAVGKVRYSLIGLMLIL